MGAGSLKNVPIVLGALVLFGCSDPPVASFVCDSRVERPDELVVAGTGAAIPLFRELSIALRQSNGLTFLVPDSIGTGGAIRALNDRAIDMGLTSRPMNPKERSSAILEIPFASTALGVAVHRDTASGALDDSAIRAIFSGHQRIWKDGTPITILQREQSDSGIKALAAADPGLAADFQKIDQQLNGKICFTDTEVFEALLSTPGAIGFVDEGSVLTMNAPLRFAPYKNAHRTLNLLVRPPLAPTVENLLGILRNEAVADYLKQHGYTPLAQEQ